MLTVTAPGKRSAATREIFQKRTLCIFLACPVRGAEHPRCNASRLSDDASSRTLGALA